MEDSHLQTSTSLSSGTHSTRPMPVFVVIIALLLGGVGGYIVGSTQKNQNNQLPQQTTSISYPTTSVSPKTQTGALGNYLLTVNGHTFTDGKEGSYLTYKLSFPSKYYATSDDMISYYKTQGGMAPPRLMLTTDSQSLARSDDENMRYIEKYGEVEKSGKDCILMWSTLGFASPEDWYNLLGKSYQVVSESKVKAGTFDAVKRIVKDTETNVQTSQAFIQLPEDVSYYFSTCNMSSDADLATILNTFDVRGELSL